MLHDKSKNGLPLRVAPPHSTSPLDHLQTGNLPTSIPIPSHEPVRLPGPSLHQRHPLGALHAPSSHAGRPHPHPAGQLPAHQSHPAHHPPAVPQHLRSPVFEIAERAKNAWELRETIENYKETAELLAETFHGGPKIPLPAAIRHLAGPHRIFDPKVAATIIHRETRVILRHLPKLPYSTIGKVLGKGIEFYSAMRDAMPEIREIVNSSDPPSLKSLRLTALAGTLAQRSLVDTIDYTADFAGEAIKGYLMLINLGQGVQAAANAPGVEEVESATKLVHTSVKYIFDTSNQAKGFWWVVDLTTDRFKISS